MLQVLYADQTVGQLWSEARELCFCYAASWVLDVLLKLKRLPRGDVYAQLAAFGKDAAVGWSFMDLVVKTFKER